jgi:glycosyltransferase involved in cell wall biosynthesis
VTGSNEAHRAAIVLPSLALGGTERVLLRFAAGLLRHGHDVHLAVLDGHGPLRAELAPGLVLHDLEQPRLSRALPRLVQTLRRLGPDLVLSSHAHINLPLLATRRLLPGSARMVIREPSLPSLSLPLEPLPRLFRSGYRRLYPSADLVLASSERMRRELACFGVTDERLRLLANPVDVAGLRHAARDPVREPGNGLRAVTVGRLEPRKGIDRLLSWWDALPDDSHLTIIGDGPDREALEAQAGRRRLEDRVHFLGRLDEPWPWMAGADALLLPSRSEGMPNAALEALAVGTPVVTTPEAGGLGELTAEVDGGLYVASAGDAFVAAVRSVEVRGAPRPRPCLLPERFDAEAAVVDLLRLVAW